MDTVAEVSILSDKATQHFPQSKIFRDADSAFKLSHLVNLVKHSRYVIVMLSYNYARRPFTLVELISALRAGSEIVTVTVSRPGLKPFDFEQVKEDIQSGQIQSYLDKSGWDTLKEFEITYRDVGDALTKVMDVRGWPYDCNQSTKVQNTMVEEILDNLKLK